MKLALLAAFLMLLGLAGVMVTTILRVHEHYTDERIDYGIVLDAGSTSTKAYIYEWHHKISASLPVVTMSLGDDKKPLSYKVKPGIATLAPNYTLVGDYLDPIIKWAHKSIPKKAHESATPIFLRGTGGLRQLSFTSGQALITNVRFKLQESGFYFDNEFASILSGTDEAGYGFISVNALYDKFQAAENEDTPKTTYGSLDLGGVSSGIAFISAENPPANYSFTTELNGTDYTIYAQSLDGFGINEARYSLNASLFLNSTGNIVQDPCAPSGYYENVTIYIGGGYHSFLLMGSSNAAQCKEQVQAMILSKTAYLPVPPVGSITFVVADHYLDVKNFFKLKDNANVLELDAATTSFCSLSYGDAMTHHKNYENEVQQYCFMGTYIVTLLTEYYGISPTQRHIFWKNTIQNAPVTWTLGAMLQHVDLMAPDNSSQARIRNIRFFHTDGGMVVLFISILIFILGLVLFILQRQRKSNDYVLIK